MTRISIKWKLMGPVSSFVSIYLCQAKSNNWTYLIDLTGNLTPKWPSTTKHQKGIVSFALYNMLCILGIVSFALYNMCFTQCIITLFWRSITNFETRWWRTDRQTDRPTHWWTLSSIELLSQLKNTRFNFIWVKKHTSSYWVRISSFTHLNL